jgi:lysozyme
MSLIDDIKKNEGYKPTVYQCTQGYDTIGYGFAIKDLYLTKEVCDLILNQKVSQLKININKSFDWYKDSPEEVKDVVTEMCYQIGLSGFSKFKKTIYYLETKQYQEASVEMLDSLWAKQTPNRAKSLSNKISEL